MATMMILMMMMMMIMRRMASIQQGRGLCIVKEKHGNGHCSRKVSMEDMVPSSLLTTFSTLFFLWLQ